jgi:hypothetical protein
MTPDAARPMLIVVLAVTLPLASAAPVSAAPAERITSLVAGAHALFALRANTVITFDSGGREIARCARFGAPAPTRQPTLAVGPIDAQELLRLAGLPDDDFQTPEAEEVLAAEGLAPRRPPRATPSAPTSPTLAHTLAASASANDVWIATSAGLYRGRNGVCARVALPGRDVIAVAAAGGAVAAATDDLLWRSTDGGATFRVVAGLVARPRALAIVDDQRTLVATDDAVIEIGPHGAVRAVLDRGGAALAVCDGLALAFTNDGAWTWRWDEVAERVGDRPPARMLACGGQAARFLAAGDSLYMSPDGATWRERSAGAGRAAAAAAIGNRIWFAADDVVVALDDIVTVQVGEGVGTPPRLALSPLPTHRLLDPVFPWPQLTLVFTAQHTPLRDGWSLVALVVFRLGRVAAARAEGGRLAGELVRRDAALAAYEMELAHGPTGPTHTADTARAAQLRAIRQEREALR